MTVLAYVIFGFIFFCIILMNLIVLEIVIRGKMNTGLSRKEAYSSLFATRKT